MSDSSDPFGGADKEAVERARRREQRDAKRRGRESRKSIADRVSGAIDGAATRGREAAGQAKERAAAARQSEPEGAEPPALRRPRSTSPDPGTAAPASPRSAPAVDHGTDDHELPPPPVTREGGASGGGETSDTGPFVAAAGSGGARGPRQPPPEAARRRRLLAGGGVLIVGVLAVAAFVVGQGGEKPPPVAKGPKQLKTVSVTIPEGLPRSEVNSVAKEAGLTGNYEKETAKAPKGFDLKKMGAPSDATLEGFLFPATYEIEKGASVDNLVDSQLTAFNENLSQIDLKPAEKKNLSVFDVVTIASMVEREVSVPGERSTVASVIYNRLKEGIPLQIDATVRYGIGNDFSRPLTESDLQSDSPYNTYQVPGLPAGPIGNPGLDSLEAAADPKSTDFLYYVVKPGTCGEHFFTNDYDEFVNAANEYDAAQAAEGGSPTEC